jgi:predicted MFS family arabinose efflux permease
MAVTYALVLAVFAVGVDTYIVAALLPAVADDLDAPIAVVGLLASAYALPTALLAPIFGPISDRRGRRFAMMLGLSIFTLAAGACVVAPSLPFLLAARLVNGLGAAIIMPAAFAAAGDSPDRDRRARTIATLSAMFPLASLLGLPIGALIAVVAGWRASFAFIAIVALVALLLLSRLPATLPDRATTPAYGAALRLVIGDRRVLSILSVTLLWACGTLGLFIYVSEFVHVTYGVPAAQAGLVYALVGVVGLIATRLSGRLIARIGPRRTVLYGISGFIVAALLLPVTAVALPVTLAVFAVWAFATWFGIPGIQTIVAELSESVRGTMLAFNSSALNLGGVIGPVVIGIALLAGGYTLATPVAALIAFLGLVVAWRVLPRVRPSVVPVVPMPVGEV